MTWSKDLWRASVPRAARLRGMSGSKEFRPSGLIDLVERFVEGESPSSRTAARHVRLNRVSPSRDDRPGRRYCGGRVSLEPNGCAAQSTQKINIIYKNGFNYIMPIYGIPEKPNRKFPAHPPPVRKHNRPIIIFLTVNMVSHSQSLLSNRAVHEFFVKVWSESLEWTVGYYLLMPDHIHLFCSPTQYETPDIHNWITYWKRSASRSLPDLKGCWQNDFWDTQIRSNDNYHRKLLYVANNPVRKGLVKSSNEWPYQGVINSLKM